MKTEEILIAAIEAYEKSLKICNSKKSLVDIKTKLSSLDTIFGICAFINGYSFESSNPIRKRLKDVPRYNNSVYSFYKPPSRCTKLSEVKVALNLRLQWLKDFQTKLKTEK